MNYLDLIILSIVGIFVIKGLFRGFFHEVLGLVGLLVGLIFATKYMSNAAVWVDEYLRIPPGLATLLGFLLIFLGIVFGFQLLAHILQKLSQVSLLGWLEKLGGGLVGFLKGATIISLLILFVSIIPFANQLIPGRADSKLFRPMKAFAPYLFDLLTEMVPDSKSFYAELKESLENFSPSELGKNTKQFLESFQDHEKTSESNSTDEQSR
jgi:membrane protein required for colicin V production